MRLVLPVAIPVLEKARRKSNLVRVTKMVTRDGVTFPAAYWVLPEEAEAEGVPSGAQFDLFEQAPPPKEDSRVPSFVYLSQPITDVTDDVTTAFRAIAADMLSFQPKDPSFYSQEELLSYYDNRLARKYPFGRSGVESFLDGLSPRYGAPWDAMKERLEAVASGEMGARIESFNAVVHSRYASLPFDDIVRLFAGLKAKSREDGKRYGSAEKLELFLYNEMLGQYPEMRDIDRALYGGDVDYLRKVAEGTMSFQYSVGKKKKIFKMAVKPVIDAPVGGDPVQQVKELVAKGISSYVDCMRIGKIIYEACGMSENADVKRLRAVIDENNALYEEYKRRYSKYEKSKRYESAPAGTFDNRGEILNHAQFEKYNAKVQAIDKDFRDWNTDVYLPKAKALEADQQRIVDQLKATTLDTPKVIDFLKQIRPFGPTESIKGKLSYSAEKNEAALKALSVFPTAWVEKMEARQFKLIDCAENRGRCGAYEVYAPWMKNSARALSTQSHELGHMMETRNNLKELSKQFLYSLADDENDGRIKSSRTHMRSWQKGLQSPHLPTQYAGVIYDDGQTEVISTAAGQLYSDYNHSLHRGEKFWHFVLGLWAGV